MKFQKTCMIAMLLCTSMLAVGKVVSINKAIFQKEVLDQKDQVVVVKVSATWCPPCQRVAPIIEEVSEKLINIKFVSMDYDSNESFVTGTLGVNTVPSFFIYKNGKRIDKRVGGFSSEQEAEKFFRSFL